MRRTDNMSRKGVVRLHGKEIWSKSSIAMFTNVSAVLTHEDGSKDIYYGKNIVTDQGDRYYASTIVGTLAHLNTTADFRGTGYMRLGTSLTAATKSDTDVGSFIANGSVALDSTYPKVSDTDSDNTGAGADIVTWRFTFGTGIGNANSISEAAITGGATGYAGGAAGTALTRFLFASTFNKTSSDTLKVFVNHEMRGTT